MKDLNVVGEMFIPPHPILGETKEAWERYKERKAKGFPCEDYMKSDDKKYQSLQEVVRCKDCVEGSYKTVIDGDNVKWCDIVKMNVLDDDFCSWAKMKGGTE